MSNLSRESPFLSEGALDTVMGRMSSSDLDLILNESTLPLKLENLEEVGDCLNEGEIFYVHPGEEISQPSFEVMPDTTQVITMPTPPVSTSVHPSMEDYRGPHDFDVQLSKSVGDKKSKWEFSTQLNKLYAVMHTKIPVKFKINFVEPGLLIRVLPVFLAQDSFSEPVKRCPTHISNLEKSNKDFKHVDHIIKCDHQRAIYDKNLESLRLSVLVPTEPPQPGSDAFTVPYSFTCKNSCGLGMNRRSTALIFTLETQFGHVVGRKIINFRICSCPRRDMMKEEESNESIQNTETERKITDSVPSGGKILIKKKVKRLSKESESVNVRIPKQFLKPLREMVLMMNNERDLTEDEKNCVDDINKHLSICTNETR